MYFRALAWLTTSNNLTLPTLFSVAVVLGIVLGNLLEENFRRAVMMDGPMVFFTEPLSLVMLIVAALLFVLPVYRNFKSRR